MRLIAVTEDDIKQLMGSLELEKFQMMPFINRGMGADIKANENDISEIHRRFHYVVVGWLRQHGSDYPT
jgi:hypothetical protein